MLNKDQFCGKITSQYYYLRFNLMNRNTIISLSMLYALWQAKHKDLIALLRPFILYAVGVCTNVGDPIEIDKICECMITEFGYKSFHPAIVRKTLLREASTNNHNDRFIEKRNLSFYLIKSLDTHISDFSSRRTECKRKSDAVSVALSVYLCKQNACGRSDYKQEEAELFLLSFFENRGNSVLQSVEDLRQILCRNNEIEYYVASYILEQYERKTVYMDYIVELVKGYFVTTAIYLQAENPDITTSSFKDVTFFLDTRILLAFLGYKTTQENDSAQEMVRSLQKSGARLACFNYNIEEVNNILNAYKLSRVQKGRKPATVTLEYFDEHSFSYTHVEAAQHMFPKKLDNGGIKAEDPKKILDEHGVGDSVEGLLNDNDIKTCVLSINPRYKLSTLADDIQAINAVSRIRDGKKYDYIECCKAVFVTSNSVLVSATKSYLEKNSFDPGFPIAITDEDLCIIAWLKNFQRNNNLPKMRLLENVMAAITPTPELMDAYFSHLDNLENHGIINDDEATLLRIDLYARRELMELTHGNPNAVNQDVIETIRKNLTVKSYEEGMDKAKQDYQREHDKTLREKRNNACKKAEKEIQKEFSIKERKGIKTIKFISVLTAIIFIVASLENWLLATNKSINFPLFVITLVTTVQGAWPFFSDNFWAIKLYKRYLKKKQLEAVDARKREYLSILE